jgi:hypothetical protein
VGGPVHNASARQILQSLGKKVFFQDDDSLQVLESNYAKDMESLVDYGVVVRMRSMFCSGRRAILVAGCGSNGVLAASLLFDSGRRFPDLPKQLRRARRLTGWLRNDDFVCVVRCTIAGEDVANVSVVRVLSVRYGLDGSLTVEDCIKK